LSFWKNQNKNLFVVSAKSSDALLLSLDYLKIKDFFVDIIGREDVSEPKPNPEAINKLISKFNLDRNKTIMIGDANVDIQMGKNAKVSTCAVTWGAGSEKELKNHNPEFIVDNIFDLITL
jgi:phosphoglycolate phosphatase